MSAPAAIVVLGAPLTDDGRPAPALARRVAHARFVAERWPDSSIVACGGRAWNGRVEADAIAASLIEQGVDRGRIFRERLSLDTLENLVEAREVLLRARLLLDVALVTCDWHMPRAVAIARKLMARVQPEPAIATPPRWGRRLHETLARVIDLGRLRLHPAATVRA
jgi:uncharacterized SAM-binding protein YcdF (DUF218 family)